MSGTTVAKAETRIVLVENDIDVRRSLTMMLRMRGYSLEVYESGAELMAMGFLPPAACYLIDLKLPHIDGMELLRLLRSAGLDAPCILMTGYYIDALAERARRAGFSGVVEKPVSADALQLLIKSVLGIVSVPRL